MGGILWKSAVAQKVADRQQEIERYLNRPSVLRYMHEQDRRKKMEARAKSWKLPVAAAGLLGAGYGLKRLGDAAISPEDRKAVEDLIALQSRIGQPIPPAPNATVPEQLIPDYTPNKDLANSRDLFYQYIDRASRASKVKVFGRDAVDWIHGVKKIIGIPEPKFPVTPKEIEDANHYSAFQAGPLPAYLHQIKKVVLEPEDNARRFLFGDAKPNTPDTRPMPQEFYGKLEGYFNRYLQDKGLSMEAAKSLNHGQQMDLIRGFHGPESDTAFTAAKDQAETALAKAQPGASAAYAGGANIALKGMQDLPRILGYTAAAAGGGLGLWWLYNYIQNKRKKNQPVKLSPEALKSKEQAEQEEKEKQMNKISEHILKEDRLDQAFRSIKLGMCHAMSELGLSPEKAEEALSKIATWDDLLAKYVLVLGATGTAAGLGSAALRHRMEQTAARADSPEMRITDAKINAYKKMIANLKEDEKIKALQAQGSV